MIRSHRDRHLRFWIALAILLPSLVIAALLARVEVPDLDRPINGIEPIAEEAR